MMREIRTPTPRLYFYWKSIGNRATAGKSGGQRPWFLNCTRQSLSAKRTLVSTNPVRQGCNANRGFLLQETAPTNLQINSTPSTPFPRPCPPPLLRAHFFSQMLFMMWSRVVDLARQSQREREKKSPHE